MNELLHVKNLSVSLKNSGAIPVKGVSFSLEQTENLTILGQSGCGKTMTCRAILGLLSHEQFQIAGSVYFHGADLLGVKEHERTLYFGNQIAFVPQNPMTALDPSQKIGRQMADFLKRACGMDKSAALSAYSNALEETGLAEVKRVLSSLPGQLSGGMLQRVLIALAIAHQAKLVIADEPTTALDAIHRDQAIEQILALQKHGCGVLLVTHDFDVARHANGKILIMKNGEIVEQGSVDHVLKQPKGGYTKELIAAVHPGRRR